MSSHGSFTASDGQDYQILPAALGNGGFGAVFAGQRADGAEVAIKRVVDAATRGRAGQRELDIALKIGQEPVAYLLAPFAWAYQGDDLLLVMPRARRNLREHLALHPDGLSEDEQLAVLHDATRGLVELSSLGVVHRDFKPANLLLYEDHWCTADFGISRDLDVRTASVTFQHAGTWPYIAPERWRGQPATHKSDLYALGCVAYEVCTGRQLFVGTQDEIQDQHLHAETPALPVAPALARLVLRLLDKDPARRPQSARAALAALPSQVRAGGGLAAAALAFQQRRHAQTVADAHLTTLAVERANARRQGLADLADLCASAAEEAQAEVPDVRWEDDGHAHRFEVDAVRLGLTLWLREPPLSAAEPLIIAGEVFAFVRGQRRRLGNIVCERVGEQQLWYLDSFVAHALTGRQEDPQGFAEDVFFAERPQIEAGGIHTWVRQRRPLTADVIVELLAATIREAARG